MSGSGISWAICKSAPCSRQTTTPAPHHSVFTSRMPFLLPNQQRQSTEGTKHWVVIAMFSTLLCLLCSSVIWSSYHKSMLASSDYEGTVTLWDAFAGVKTRVFQVCRHFPHRCMHDSVLDGMDSRFFKVLFSPVHCLHSLLPPVKSNPYGLRSRDHNLQLPVCNSFSRKLLLHVVCFD